MISNVTSSNPGAPVSALTQGPGGKMGKEEFLKLFVAQIRNQDPLNPMQGQEVAAQLAQFSTVEQLLQMNEKMDGQGEANAAVIQAMNSTAAMGALGRTVLAIGNEVMVSEEGAGSVNAMVSGSGGAATLRIYDSSGREVGSRELGVVQGGRGTWELGEAAEKLEPGRYTYAIEVKDASGNAVPVQTLTTARIDGIRFGSEGPMLTAGPISIPIGKILEIVAGS